MTALVLALAASGFAGWKDDVGYEALQSRLGASAPSGVDVIVVQAEALSSGNYLPDPARTEFAGKSIVARSGTSGVSSHATTVALNFYGSSSSIAPGIPTIYAYNANHWVGSGLLRYNSGLAPATEVARVENHSWIGTTGTESLDSDLLRRVDWVADRDGVVVAAGVNNGQASAMPMLLGSAYNVLAVGLTNGQSSYGPTRIDVAGRVKPNLVAPSSQTSYATPMVASAAALLWQAVDDAGALASLPPDQRRPAEALLIRALLMGGATKAEFPDWRKGFAVPVADGTVPFDYRYGAGELNVDNSHRILTAGRQPAGPTIEVAQAGWDLGAASSSNPQQYSFQIPESAYAASLSVLVTWNRRIVSAPGAPLVLTPSLADLNLFLRRADGTEPGEEIDASISSVDNVEHLFLGGLRAGRYLLEVTSDVEWTYAITWDMTLAPTPPGDLDGNGVVDRDDVDLFARCATGPHLGPVAPECSRADLDSDSDIDAADFAVLQRSLNGH